MIAPAPNPQPCPYKAPAHARKFFSSTAPAHAPQPCPYTTLRKTPHICTYNHADATGAEAC